MKVLLLLLLLFDLSQFSESSYVLFTFVLLHWRLRRLLVAPIESLLNFFFYFFSPIFIVFYLLLLFFPSQVLLYVNVLVLFLLTSDIVACIVIMWYFHWSVLEASLPDASNPTFFWITWSIPYCVKLL